MSMARSKRKRRRDPNWEKLEMSFWEETRPQS